VELERVIGTTRVVQVWVVVLHAVVLTKTVGLAGAVVLFTMKLMAWSG
jgi:hypothetical protein